MQINFLIPFIQKTGGILVVLEHARQLWKQGHDVCIYYPLLPYIELLHDEKSLAKKIVRGQIKPFLLNLFRLRKQVPWYHHPVPVTPVPWMNEVFIRDADVTIATTWITAYGVERLGNGKGRKFHFIQGYEQWNADPDLVDGAYRLPLAKLTIAPWLTELMKTRFRLSVKAEIPNGVDMDLFRPPASRSWSSFTILMIYHEQKVKGTGDGLEVLERIHRRYPSARIVLFGPTPFSQCPDYIEFHLKPSVDSIVRLYQNAQIFLCPSHNEGWHLPPMEAMACQCAVVATAVGCIPTLYEPGNMLVSEPHDVENLVDNVAYLMDKPEECERMAMKGYATIGGYTWEKAAARLLKAIEA